MNEPTPETTITAPGKKKRSLFLPIAGVIIAIAVIGFIASRAGLDKALVKQQLDDFAMQLKERGKAQGRDLSFTYGDLEVVGSFASKHVVIHNPSLGVKPLERKAAMPGEKKPVDALLITTPTAEIYPQAADLSALKIQLPEPINFASEDEPSKSLLKVTSNVPVVVVAGQKKQGELAYREFSFQSPTEIALTYLREEQAKGEEEQTPAVVPVYQTLNISTAQGSGFSSSFAADASGLGEAKIFFKELLLTPKEAPEGAVNIAEITGDWTNALNEKKLNVLHGTLKMGPVTSKDAALPYLPVALDVDATYEGAMLKTPESVASIEAQESTMVLKNLTLTTKDASLKATANFTANASDMLPVGTANVALSNAPLVLGELRKYGIINEKNEPMITALLVQMTGTPIEQIKDVAIPIERARGGAFKIGQTTFEELFATLLKGAMQQKSGEVPVTGAAPAEMVQPPLVPQLPPADKPKSAPIEVPDHGVRG